MTEHSMLEEIEETLYWDDYDEWFNAKDEVESALFGEIDCLLNS